MKFNLLSTYLLLLLPVLGYNQELSTDYSPFSRFGLGDFLDQNTISINSMGNLSASFHDPNMLNLVNPASLGDLKTTIFESGFNARYSQLTEGDQKKNTWSGNLRQLSVGLAIFNPINEVLAKKPYKLKWGMHFSLLPYTKLGYKIVTTEVVNNLPFEKTFQCSGGTYKFMWGNGIKIKDFSFGANLGLIFGKMNFERNIAITSGVFGYEDFFQNNITIKSFYYNVGAQYDWYLRRTRDTDVRNQEKVLTFGIYGNGKNPTKITADTAFYRVHNYLGITDTALLVQDQSTKGNLPEALGIGFMYRYGNKFKIGSDFSYNAWSKYTNPNKSESLRNGYSLSVGGEFTPNILAFNKFFSKVSYRLGYVYQKDPRVILNQQLQTQGITVGLGIPLIVARELSFLNIGCEFGKLTGYNNLTENYIKLNLGFAFTDNGWFIKRRFD
ncbi:MAG: hypothetical protein IPQ18_11405 [Saprospiraceae bacterium]|nr:hypothetical protein [Saprospiraceae bacterium]